MFKSGKANWMRAEGALLPIGCCLVPDLDMSLCFPEMSLSFTESEDFDVLNSNLLSMLRD
jgi:hypothetical protein